MDYFQLSRCDPRGYKGSRIQEFNLRKQTRRLYENSEFSDSLLYIIKETIMNKFYVFVLRAILGLVFAVILSRFFYSQLNILYISGLFIFLVGTAYVLDYVRSGKQ